MDILNMSNWVDYDMKFPKKCPHCKQTFYMLRKTHLHIIL